MTMSQIKKATKALEKSVRAAQNNPYRPQYHFVPPANWMNDPNGTIIYRGEYHLFYQHNPYKPGWGRIHWGHAKSTDLVHWEQLPIALAPDTGIKELHCFSGCCVIADDGTPTIFYTNISAKSFATAVHRYAEQWAATSDSDLLVWEKHPGSPILSDGKHHKDDKLRNWRDPYIWKSGATWYMVITGQVNGEKVGSVLLYQSNDLYDWEYLGPLYQGEPQLGKTWECPNYFQIGGKSVLVVSPFRQVIYSIGEFKDHQHVGDTWYTFDHGKDFYATNTYIDDKNRTILVGWIKVAGKGSWAGCLSLPREVRLDHSDHLVVSPILEFETLRQKHRRFTRTLDSSVEIAGTAPYFGECVEIKAKFKLASAESVGFKLIDDEGEHQIAYNFGTHTLQAVNEDAKLQFIDGNFELELHIFIDKSVIEVFINRKETFTTIFYPNLGKNNALKIAPFFVKAQGTVEIDFWTLEDIGL